MTRRSHCLLALNVTLLAFTVAAGVTTPRPRLGRERALRTVALAGCTRSDQTCVWGSADDPEPEVTVVAGNAFAPAGRQTTPEDPAAVLPSLGPVARAAAPRLAVASGAVVAVDATAASGPPPGRAPPVSRS